MTILHILHFPDPRLREKAQPIAVVDDSIRVLAQDMLDTMYDAPGIGLAAPQVNVLKRLIVIDISENNTDPVCLVNPQIIDRAEIETTEEGCLSVPGIYENVDRAAQISVRALDLKGDTVEFDADGMLAVCIQHEIDHLDGKLFVDYLSSMKQARIRKKLEKQQRHAM